jgi:hypothetical protein
MWRIYSNPDPHGTKPASKKYFYEIFYLQSFDRAKIEPENKL